MNILIFQHLAVETAGVFAEIWQAAGHTMRVVALDEGDEVPPLDGFDLLAVMGGPMDVWQEDRHPWLIAEKAAIRRWVTQKRPYFGICLGHQLLASAMGGSVGPMATPEVGLKQISLTDAGKRDAMMAGLPPAMTTLQWHGAEVTTLPQDTVVLAGNSACTVQAMRVGPCAWGVQYHIEITPDAIAAWFDIPEYRAALHAAIGAEAANDLHRDTLQLLPQFRQTAEHIAARLTQA